MRGLADLFEPGPASNAIVIAAIHAISDMIGRLGSDDSSMRADALSDLSRCDSQELAAP